jgi:hypothetical protein
MAVSPNEGSFFNPKWFVIGFALAGFALIITYDLRLGLAAGAVLAMFAGLWLYPALRLGLIGGERPSSRRAMQERLSQQLSNRRKAERGGDDRSGA